MVEAKTPKLTWLATETGVSGYSSMCLQKSLFEPLEAYMQRPCKAVRFDLVQIGAMLGPQSPSPSTISDMGYLIEGVHCGSLIVDDIQDGSRERRHGPSFHLEHGIPRALNAGNWLYFWALQRVHQLEAPKAHHQAIFGALVDMFYQGHLGQALDLGQRIDEVPLHEVAGLCEQASRLKTGALTGTALVCGAILAGADSSVQKELQALGVSFGILLQQLDDLKNIRLGSTEPASKVFEDLRNRRPGFLWWFATERLGAQACAGLKDSLHSLPDTDAFQEWLQQTQFLVRAKRQVDEGYTKFGRQLDKLFLKHGWDKTLKERLGALYQRLEDAYAKA